MKTLTVASASGARIGVDFVQIGTVRDGVDGEGFGPLIPLPGGSLFGTVGSSRTLAGVSTTVETPAIYDPRTHRLTRLPESGRPGQIIAAAQSPRWIVWLQTRSTTLDQTPWELYSYDRRRQTTRLLAVAPHTSAGAPTAPGYSWPSIGSDGMVYLAAVYQDGDKQRAYVARVPVDGSGRLNKVAPGVAPSASGDWLVWGKPFGKVEVEMRALPSSGGGERRADGVMRW